MWDFIRKTGRLRFTLLASLIVVLSSVAITEIIFSLANARIPTAGLVTSICAPAIISFPMIWYILGLLFKVHKMEEEMRELATYDQLTGAYNRRSLFEIAEKYFEIARRQEEMISVLFLDIDHFKRVNDTHGHSEGDNILKAVSRTIQATLRKSDALGRFGGEEFILILLNTDKNGAYSAAEKVRKQVENLTIYSDKKQISVTISIGLTSTSEKKASNINEMMRDADEALYQAKKNGRNQTVIYKKEVLAT